MSKRGKRLDENMLENRIIVSLIIIASIVAIVIGYIWISNSVKKKSNLSKQLADQNSSNQSNKTVVEDKNANEESESASTSIGKTVEDSKNTNEEENIQGDTTNEIASSVNNSQKTNNSSSSTTENNAHNITSEETTSTNNSINNDTNNTQNDIENQQNVSSNEENIQPSFIMPTDGEILKAFSKENLVFSETLQEWITHQALDIKANSRDIVKCSADGTVKAIKSDPRYGLTVIVEHSSGFQTVYSNLLTAEFVVEGEQVKQGQTLGTVGNSAIFEIADESHLHFEMLLNSEYVDPSLYINN